MSERFEPKRILQDPDVSNIGAFGGLSSASYQSTGDILYADKLVNATITSRNEVKRRRGSRILTNANNFTLSNAANSNSFRFTYDGITYIIQKANTTVFLYALDSNDNLLKTVSKVNVFNTLSASEPVSFTNVIEDDVCYILMATRSTPLRVGVIVKKNLDRAITIVNPTRFTGVINNYPTPNSITNTNSFLYDQGNNNRLVDTTNITQATSTLTVDISTAYSSLYGLTTPADMKLHAFYWCATTSANYYPGSYLYNSALRRNSIPLDVNVQLPTEISSNPIINESDIQDLIINSTRVWQTQQSQNYTRAATNQPLTATEWDFSDGSYTATPFHRTTRTPNFISFGGLSAGGNNERIYLFRLRELLVSPTIILSSSNLQMFYDTNATTVNLHNGAGATATTNLRYFSVPFDNRPSLSTVVEICYTADLPTTNFANLDRNNLTISVGDGSVIPLYGISFFANIRSSNYPNLVLSVGNRVILSGLDNRVAFSNADWNYRGISWNNFQVSTINFTSTSAYSVALSQQTSRVIGLASVNGVIIVATDTGIFRISGENSQTPPNATTANISRLSNEIVSSSDCLLVYENKVYYTSSNGLYQLQYNQDIDELTPTPVSVQVTDIFRRVPICLNYSPTYRAFIIGFNSGQELLVYSFESETFSTFKFAFVSPRVFLSQTLDGYQVLFAETDGEYTVCLCQWDNTLTTDISNASTLPSTTTIVGTSVNISTAPTDVSVLSTPAELIETLDTGSVGDFVVAYGENTVRLLSGSPQTLTEHTGGRQPTPILSFYVSKAFMSDKLTRSHRVRSINLLVAGTGELTTSIYFPNKDNSQSQQTYEITSVNLSPGVVRERANVETRTASGDLVNVRLRLAGGVGEGWVIACQLTQDLLLLGYQFDTSVKKRGRLQ